MVFGSLGINGSKGMEGLKGSKGCICLTTSNGHKGSSKLSGVSAVLRVEKYIPKVRN